MFVSQPHYEFRFPPGIEQQGWQHWRMVELALHVPWFLLSLEVDDADSSDCRLIRTICIAFDTDLCEVLQSLEADSVTGIVCMMPAWLSPNSQWSSREIQEVWLHTSQAGQSVVLRDVDGQQFDCGVVTEHTSPVLENLVLRVTPARSREDAPGGRKSMSQADRRAGEAIARKSGR